MANLNNRFVRVWILLYLSGSIALLIGGCAAFSSNTRRLKEINLVFQEAQQRFNAGQFSQAIELWEQVPPSAPQYMDAQLGIHAARLQIEQIKQQQSAESRKLSQVETYLAQAEQLEHQGDLPEAIKKYEEARLLDPKNRLLHNKIEELHALLNNALERHTRLGEMYLAQGEYEKSKAEWESLLHLEASNEKAKQRLADLEVLTATSDAVFVKRGKTLFEKGLINAAKVEFEKARRVNPANERTLDYLSQLESISFTEYTVQKGDSLSFIAEKYTKNPSNYKILADFNAIPNNARLKIGQVIRIPHVLGFRKALAPEKKDLVIEPTASNTKMQAESEEGQTPETTEDPKALQRAFSEGVAAFQEERYREAMSLLEKVLLHDPENEKAYMYFVRASENVRRGTSGGEIFPERSEQTDSLQSEVQALLQAGLSYREVGDIKQAIATFEQAYQLAPEDPQVVKYLEEARDDLKKLITAYLNEGIKQFNQDSLKDAILEWDKVLELDPSNQQAAEYKKRAQTMLDTLAP
jgi:tetratricopeptide (TPR) repeat protein